MAGDWIPMRVDLADDPAVIQVAAALGLDEFAVVGRLHRLWSWANRHLTTGDAQGVAESWVDRYVSTPGFAAALLAAGWLRTRSGHVEFPNFDRWNSQGAKTRLVKARQKRVERSRATGDTPGPRGTVASPPMSPPDGDISATNRRPEKRRGEKKEVPNGTSAAGPGPAREAKSRKRDELFDAVAEVTATDPAAGGSHVGKVRALLAKADPPYTPAEVREFAARLNELCDWTAREKRTRPTLGEIEKYIGRLRAPRALAAGGPPVVKTAADIPMLHAPSAPPMALPTRQGGRE